MSIRGLICDLSEVLVCLPLRWDLSTAAGQRRLEGHKTEVSRWSSGAYTARWKVMTAGGRYELWKYHVPKVCSEWGV